jgi:hypothetical protein
MTCSSIRSNPLRAIVAFQYPKKKLTVGGFYAILVDIARRASLKPVIQLDAGLTKQPQPLTAMLKTTRYRKAADLRQRRFVTPCGMLLFSLNHPAQYAQRRARSWTVVLISAPERQLENARSVMYWLSANGSSGYG